MARSYFVKSKTKKHVDIVNFLHSADYNKVLRVHGVNVWRFGADDYAVVEWVHPVYGYSEIWNNYGVHMTANQLANKILGE